MPASSSIRPAVALGIFALAIPVAQAQSGTFDLDIHAATAGEAAQALARRTGTSIGFGDPALAARSVRSIRARLPVAVALARILAGSGLRARETAPDAFLIEAAPRETVREPLAATGHPKPKHETPPPPPAQSAAAIVVTGAKRRVPLDAYPGVVDVIMGDSISSGEGAGGTDLIEARTTTVSSTHLGSGRNKLFVRGIADSSFVGPTQATVGQYWGNSRITYSAPDPSLRLYDVARIEVLEGPQGTLYGAGSLGGVVRVVPNAPDPNAIAARLWGGTMAVQHGQPGVDGGALLNVPLVQDRVAVRAMAFGGQDGGYIDDTLRKLNDINTVRTYGGKVALRFTPNDDWTIDASVIGQRIGGADSQYTNRAGNGLTRASAIAQPYSNAIMLGEIVLGRRWQDMDLTASVTYAGQHVFEQFEGQALTEGGDPAIEPAANAVRTAYTQQNWIHMLTGELRLARSRPGGTGWLLALSMLRNTDRIRRQMGGTDTTGLQTQLESMGGMGGMVGRSYLTGVRNLAQEATVYGEYSLPLAAHLSWTVGGRMTRSWLSGMSQDVSVAVALRNDPNAGTSRSESRALPSTALVWRPVDNISIFARYQESFRPGGIAIRRDFIERFQGDRVKATEIGLKWHSARLASGLTFSWTRWQNIQADLIDGFGFPTTANIGDGRVLSVGWTGSWKPVSGLQFDAGVLANDSHLLQTSQIVQSLTDTVIDRSRLPNVADWIGRVSSTYHTAIGSSWQLDLSGYARYTGKSTLGLGSILGQTQGNYLDTGIDLTLAKGSHIVSLGLTNLLARLIHEAAGLGRSALGWSTAV